MSKTLLPRRGGTSDHVSPASVERYNVPPKLPPGAIPAKAMLGSVVEKAASDTSPPGGPSDAQFPFPPGRIMPEGRGCKSTNEAPDGRFPRSSSRRAGWALDTKSFSKFSADELPCTDCDEPIRAANVLDMVPRLATRTQPLSNTTRNPHNRRDLEYKQLESEALFIVRF
jgi:hypothetical protein